MKEDGEKRESEKKKEDGEIEGRLVIEGIREKGD